MLKGSNTGIAASAVRISVHRQESESPARGSFTCALLLTAAGRVRSGGDLLLPGRPAHSHSAVRHEATWSSGRTTTETLAVEFDAVEPAVSSIVLATVPSAPTVRGTGFHLRIADAAQGTELADFVCDSAGEGAAVVLGEFYRRSGSWRFRAIGQEYSGGFEELAADFGLPADSVSGLRVGMDPARSPGDRHGGTKVLLTKGAPTVSLAKHGGGAMTVSLNWQPQTVVSKQAGPPPKAMPRNGVDLDLAALYELTDGTTGAVQAAGKWFGSLEERPFIRLDQDDRTGGSLSGENLTINLDHSSLFRRILVFVSTYRSTDSFTGLRATVTLRAPAGPPIGFSLEEGGAGSRVCALALITPDHLGDLVVRREARYLTVQPGSSPQRAVDAAYDWGIDWVPSPKE
ncbi:TerD family protein [Streptomyces sp. Lzd4kr]|nr:TerD family protein [Streptomyces sp. Lzd4kr]